MPKSQFIEWDTDHKGAGQVDTTALPEYVTSELAAAGGEPQASRRWRMARDKSHVVVEVDLGRKRTAVVTLRHDDHGPDGVVHHPSS